jgi:L-2-hydroxyglutarate oxidase LhgO
MVRHDVAVVGAGILGLTVARELLLRRPGSDLVVIEREREVAAHQTGHNSGVVHGGIYYVPGSLKARLCLEGSRRMYEYCDEHGVPYERCGKLVVARHAGELGRLDALEERGRANGVPGLRRVSAAEIAEIEPAATGVAALHAPNTGIVDYATVARSLRAELEEQGVTFLLGSAARSVRERPDGCEVLLDDEVVEAGRVVACAGLWSDRLARASGAGADPRIVPFRGGYLRLVPEAAARVRGLVYPVPDPSLPFLGVHVTRHIDGTVSLGPTALMVPSRDGYRLGRVRARDTWESLSWPGTWRVAGRHWRTGATELRTAASRRAFVRAAAEYVPSLRIADLDGTSFAGVRAQAVARDGTLVDDFVLAGSGRVTHVRNAPSPGATASFAIAREIVDRIDAGTDAGH